MKTTAVLTAPLFSPLPVQAEETMIRDFFPGSATRTAQAATPEPERVPLARRLVCVQATQAPGVSPPDPQGIFQQKKQGGRA